LPSGKPTKQALTKAYRTLASKHHPDKYPEGTARDQANAMMQAINAARDYVAPMAI
jgi:DnaJ-class molecular chaperone